MSRSLKKGPYTFPRLLKRVRDLNEKGKKDNKTDNSKRKQKKRRTENTKFH